MIRICCPDEADKDAIKPRPNTRPRGFKSHLSFVQQVRVIIASNKESCKCNWKGLCVTGLKVRAMHAQHQGMETKSSSPNGNPPTPCEQFEIINIVRRLILVPFWILDFDICI